MSARRCSKETNGRSRSSRPASTKSSRGRRRRPIGAFDLSRRKKPFRSWSRSFSPGSRTGGRRDKNLGDRSSVRLVVPAALDHSAAFKSLAAFQPESRLCRAMNSEASRRLGISRRQSFLAQPIAKSHKECQRQLLAGSEREERSK